MAGKGARYILDRFGQHLVTGQAGATRRNMDRRCVVGRVAPLRFVTGWLCTLVAFRQPAGVETASCGEALACQEKVNILSKLLDETHEHMEEKRETLKALESLRRGVLSGDRISLPSAQRRHLLKAVPSIGAISYDARHKPESTNMTKQLKFLRTLTPSSQVSRLEFLTLSASSTPNARKTVAMLTLDKADSLSVHAVNGSSLLEDFDPGHKGKLTHIAMSRREANNCIGSVDASGQVRVHSLALSWPRITPKLIGSFEIPGAGSGATRTVTALLLVEHRSEVQVLVGDVDGGISVFFANGTRQGRVQVVNKEGGVVGLLRAQGTSVLFHSALSFGTFSFSQMDVLYPPCSGWQKPVVEVAIDTSLKYSRVVLGLEDGDVLVYSTQRGQTKACDLTFKFPRVTDLPMQMHLVKGYTLGLPYEKGARTDYPMELFFFNLAAMQGGYGSGSSRAVAVQLDFGERRPIAFALHEPPFSTEESRPSAGKQLLALRFDGSPGVELHELSLRQAQAPKSGGGDAGGKSDVASWLEWFPKFGIFGIALVGVVIWNVRKVTSKSNSGGPVDDFDEAEFIQQLKERRKAAAAAKEAPNLAGRDGASGAGGAGASSSSSGSAAAPPTNEMHASSSSSSSSTARVPMDDGDDM